MKVFEKVSLSLTALSEALSSRDKDTLKGLQRFREEAVKEIDALQDQTLKEIALKQPFGKDFRRLAALLKISTSLERVARYITHAAEYAYELIDKLPETLLRDISRMASLADKALNNALEAFFSEDFRFIERSVSIEEEIDKLFRGLRRSIVARAREGCKIEESMLLALLARSIERIGDHAVEIMRRTEYYLQGELPWKS